MRIFLPFIVAAGFVLAFSDSARADLIVSSLSLQASFSSPVFNTLNLNYSSTWEGPSPSQQVQFLNGTYYYPIGGATLPLSIANPSYDHAPYTVQLALDAQTENGEHLHGTASFSGVLNGNPLNMTNTIVGPSEQSVDLGAGHVNVTLLPFLPTSKNELYLPTGWTMPTYPPQWSFGDPSHGYIYAGVTGVDVVRPFPEPSALVLAGLGLFSCGIAAWRKGRGRRHRLAA